MSKVAFPAEVGSVAGAELLDKNVFGPGHDGHFVIYTDLLTAAIEWGRRLALVSISEDGSSLPVIKA